MPYEIELQRPVVYVRLFGLVGVEEIARAVTEITSDRDFDGQRFFFVDFGAATLPAQDPKLLYAIAPAIGATVTNPRITAIVVPDNAEVRALSAFCAPVLGGLQSILFLRDRAQADDWIQAQTATELGAGSHVADAEKSKR